MKEKTSLKNKAICGIFWSAVERFLSQGIQFVVTVIMARFLLPSDYGMVGMLAIVLQLSQTLMDSGFTNALIRYKERTEIDYSTVFFFNILASLVIYFLIFFLAPYISWFYKIGQLVEITRILSIVIVLNSFAIIPKTKLIIKSLIYCSFGFRYYWHLGCIFRFWSLGFSWTNFSKRIVDCSFVCIFL